jgi:RHS repeat-associated protein
MQIVNPTDDTILASSHFIPYDPNKTYFASGYVQIQDAKGIAGIQATGYDANGNITKRIKSNEISGTQGPTRLHAAVEPGAFPANTTRFRIRAYVFGKSGQYDGTYTFDGLQIEEGFFGAYNIVENGDFERNDDPVDDIPDRWFLAGNIEGPDGLDSTEKHVGEQSVKLVGNTTKWKTVRQDIKLSGYAGSILTVSGFSKVENPRTSGVYGYIIETYQGSTLQETFTHNFDRTKSHDWQHRTAQLKTTKPFDNIKVFYEYSLQTGTAWFDTAKVIIGPVQTRYQYDANGNYQTRLIDPEGRILESTYDAVGNLTSEKIGTNITSFSNDGADQLTKVVDTNGNQTRYEHDANGNRTKVINAHNKGTTFEYNELNEIKKVTDPLNKSIQFDYDINGRQVKITYPDGSSVESGYDAVDRQTSVSYNGVERYSFEYDPNGNLTKETDQVQNESIEYTYDADNKLKSVIQPKDNKTEYKYDKNGNVIEQKYTVGSKVVTHEMEYNELDQLTQINENGTRRADYTYDENDRIASRKNKDGTVSLFTYNGAGDWLEQVLLNGNGEEIDRFIYSYDSKGNITKIDSLKGTIRYEYDGLNQLSKEILTDGTIIEYTHDAVGNRLTRTISKNGDTTTTNYTYDGADQLTEVNGTKYSYDENGNLIFDDQRTYVYDTENRLVEVREGNNTLASFTYRSDGMRKTKTTSDGTVTFHYNEYNQVSYETDQNNKILAIYTYGSKNELISMTRGDQTYYYQTNYRGDVVALTDSEGTVVATYDYDSFGNLLSETGSVENPYRYAGYRYDELTGLYYLQSRYYNPDTGRFLTRDTFEGYENEPLSLNKYVYTANNPVMLVDYDGYSYSNLNKSEKKLVKKNPWVANKVRSAANKAKAETVRRFGKQGHNDCSDAFRHAYWNALMVKRVGKNWAKRWGDAHEQNPKQPKIEKKMDLHNNAVGRKIAIDNPKASEKKLSNLVYNAVKDGRLKKIGSNRKLVKCK